MSRSDAEHRFVVAGAGYAGLHAALRLATKLRDNPEVVLTLVNRHDYHQVLTELPRVAGGTRAADAVRIPLEDVLAERVRFVQTQVTGFDLADRRLLTEAGPIPYTRLVLALGSRPNDFAIPGLAERALGLVLGQLCRVADLVFDLLGGRPVSGRGRPECGVGHAVLPFYPAAAGHLAESASGCR